MKNQLFTLTDIYPTAEQQKTNDYPQSLLKGLYNYYDGFLIPKFKKHRHKPTTLRPQIKIGEFRAALVSRQIWIWHHGEIPDGLFVDHENRNPLDNRIENLRLAHRPQNQWNRTKNKNKNYDAPKGFSIRYESRHRKPWKLTIRLKSMNEIRRDVQIYFKYRHELEAEIVKRLDEMQAFREHVHGEFHSHG
jgi:hypothetical protein